MSAERGAGRGRGRNAESEDGASCCWRRPGRAHSRPPSWIVPGENRGSGRGWQNGTTAPEKGGSTSSGEKEQADGTPDAEQIEDTAGTPRSKGGALRCCWRNVQEAAELETAAHEKENGNKKALRIDARPER